MSRRRPHIIGRGDQIAFGAQHEHRPVVLLRQRPVQAQREVEQRAWRFRIQVPRGLRENLRRHVGAEVEWPQRLRARPPTGVTDRRRPSASGSWDATRRGGSPPAAVPSAAPAPAAPLRARVAWRRSARQCAAPIEWPISTGGVVERPGDVLDVGFVVIESGDEQRVRAAARAVAAQAQCVSGIATGREPRQKDTAPRHHASHSRRGRRAAAACAGLRRAGACEPRGALQAAALTSGNEWTSRIENARHCDRPIDRDADVRRVVPPLRPAGELPAMRCNGVSGVPVPAGAAVWRSRGTARHRRARARHARRQRERPAVHRRFRGHPAVRDAARLRLCVVAGFAHADDPLTLTIAGSPMR